jgi:UDP-N-acetylglucosamine 2-epimerase (non-hydrolysing)
MTVAVVTGTRPEIIKMFPVIKQLDYRSIDYKFIHTGQHYDYALFLKFVDEFGIQKPDVLISLDASGPVDQVSAILKQMGTALDKIKPSVVMVQGDTNSVLATALAALKSHFPISHIESGLRSNDWKTVEEHNRRIVDHISDVLFSPTETSTKNLQNERVYGEIHTVGNTVIDAINLCLDNERHHLTEGRYNDKPGESDQPVSLGVDPQTSGDFVLVTMHRSENVDDLNNLKQVLMALSESNLTYVFPMHPHTLNSIKEYGLINDIPKRIKIIPPLGYLDFLELLRKCRFVITDSGGVQEEITSPKINKRAIILRDCTERPESVESGHSVLCKLNHISILDQIKIFESNNTNRLSSRSPYGDGDSANKIAQIIEKKFQ